MNVSAPLGASHRSLEAPRPSGDTCRRGRPPRRRLPRGAGLAVGLALGLSALAAAKPAPPKKGCAAPLPPIAHPLDRDALLLDTFGEVRAGGKRAHEGIDMMAPKGTPVLAVADGVVTWMHDEKGGRCCALVIRHDDGWSSRYIHLDNDTPGTDDGQVVGIAEGVVRGARVRQGQLIGWVGDSGNAESCDPHLHFELRDPEGRPVDVHPVLVALQAERAGS